MNDLGTMSGKQWTASAISASLKPCPGFEPVEDADESAGLPTARLYGVLRAAFALISFKSPASRSLITAFWARPRFGPVGGTQGAPIWRRDDETGQTYALKLTAAGAKAIARLARRAQRHRRWRALRLVWPPDHRAHLGA